MDTSKEYIKMVNCPEIQSQWRKTEGDVYWNEFHIGIYDSDRLKDIEDDFHYTWLPRQGQLIGMLDNNEGPLIIEMIDTHFWNIKAYCVKNGEKLIRDIYNRKSCEIALLETVMILLHNKTWDGEKWVK